MFNREEIILGIIIGTLIGMLLLYFMLKITNNGFTKYHEAKAKCEETLPRNQQCKIVGVPINENL